MHISKQPFLSLPQKPPTLLYLNSITHAKQLIQTPPGDVSIVWKSLKNVFSAWYYKMRYIWKNLKHIPKPSLALLKSKAIFKTLHYQLALLYVEACIFETFNVCRVVLYSLGFKLEKTIIKITIIISKKNNENINNNSSRIFKIGKFDLFKKKFSINSTNFWDIKKNQQNRETIAISIDIKKYFVIRLNSYINIIFFSFPSQIFQRKIIIT